MESFFHGLDKDIRDNLKQQLNVYWTYASNALEGSSLTLGDTDFIIREGLTIGGKPLRDHKDAEGHYIAVAKIYDLMNASAITEDMLFQLHKIIMPQDVMDIYRPVGAWKNSVNGTYIFNESLKRSIWLEYPQPEEIPDLMRRWISFYNSAPLPEDKKSAIQIYSNLHTLFVAIHPFFDGNGRMARLVANIPILKAGYPPILIDPQFRNVYIQTLAGITHSGKWKSNFETRFPSFEKLVSECWKKSFELVQSAHQCQAQRTERKLQLQKQGLKLQQEKKKSTPDHGHGFSL